MSVSSRYSSFSFVLPPWRVCFNHGGTPGVRILFAFLFFTRYSMYPFLFVHFFKVTNTHPSTSTSNRHNRITTPIQSPRKSTPWLRSLRVERRSGKPRGRCAVTHFSDTRKGQLSAHQKGCFSPSHPRGGVVLPNPSQDNVRVLVAFPHSLENILSPPLQPTYFWF